MKLSKHTCRNYLLTIAFLLAFTTYENLPASAGGEDTSTIHTNKYKQHELLVKFKTEVPAERIRSLHRDFGSIVIRTFKSTGVQHIHFPEKYTVLEALAYYRFQAEVLYAEPNQPVFINSAK